MHLLLHAARRTPCQIATPCQRLNLTSLEAPAAHRRCISRPSPRPRPQASKKPAPKPDQAATASKPSGKHFRLPESLPRYAKSAFPKALSHDTKVELCTRVRRSMRFVSHPVAIVSTVAERPDGWGSEIGADTGLLRGLIVSSFNIVSLDPVAGPIVSFNLKTPSTTLDAIRNTGAFDISLPWAPELCRTFSDPKSRDQLAQGDLRKMLHEQSVFTLQCKWLQEKSIPVADHMIMVGSVEGYVHEGAVRERLFSSAKLPLNYASGVLMRMYAGIAVAEDGAHPEQKRGVDPSSPP